jgi:hypothetical protein
MMDWRKDILESCNAVTEPMVQRAGGKLPAMKKGEKSLGVLHNMETRKLWIVMDRMRLQSSIQSQQSNVAETEEEAAALQADSERLTDLAVLAKHIFWCQLKDDMDGWHYNGNVGLRRDYMVVVTNEEKGLSLDVPDSVQRLFRMIEGAE